jgi:hypothetical protein
MRPQHAAQSRAKRATLVALTLVAIAASGCGRALPTAPVEDASAPAPHKAAPEAMSTTASYTWYQLASQWVNKGEAATVSGGRYKIAFVRGSLGAGATVTVKERDALLTDCVVGPSGMALAKAATLSINYAGSAVATAAGALKLYRLNEATGVWEPVAGTNDLSGQSFSAKVLVLGRYAVSAGDPTKAGW